MYLGTGLLSAYFAARCCRSQRSYKFERAVRLLGAEYHALAFYPFQLTGGEIGYEAYLCAYQVFRLVVFGYAAHDGASAHAVVYSELEEFVCFGDFDAFQYCSHTYVKLLKCGEIH